MPGGTGAAGNTRPTKLEQPKKKSSNKTEDVYISLYFSFMSYDRRTVVDWVEYEVNGNHIESSTLVYSTKALWSEGSFSRENITQAFFIDCSQLVVNIGKGEIDDAEGMIDLLDESLELVRRSIPGLDGSKKDKVKLHFIISADVEVQDMAYAMNYVAENKMLDSIKDPELVNLLTSEYKSYFKRYKDKGWEIKVDYTGLHEVIIACIPAFRKN
jgi:hypothetical protein